MNITDKKQEEGKPAYESPVIKSFSCEGLLAELGPAQAIYGPLPFN